LVAFVLLVLVTAVTLGASLARSNADVIAAGSGPGPGALLRPADTFPVVRGTDDARRTAAPSPTAAAAWVPAGLGGDTSAPVSAPGRASGRHPETAPAVPGALIPASGRARAGAPAARLGAGSSVGVTRGTARTSGKAVGRLQDARGPDQGDNPRRARLSATAVRVALARLAG
jgi:hypothetical protein